MPNRSVCKRRKDWALHPEPPGFPRQAQFFEADSLMAGASPLVNLKSARRTVMAVTPHENFNAFNRPGPVPSAQFFRPGGRGVLRGLAVRVRMAPQPYGFGLKPDGYTNNPRF